MNLITEKSKKLLKLIDINLKYLINKKTITIISFSFFIITIAFIFNTNFLSSKASKLMYSKEYYDMYLNNSYNILIVVFAFFSISISIIYSNDYDAYLITRRTRREVIISKLISCAILLFLYLYISFCIFVIIPSILMNYFVVTKEMISSFVFVFLNGLFLMILSIFLYEISNNILSSFVILVLFWVVKIFTTSKIKKGSFIYVINQIYPSLIVEEEEVIQVFFPNNFIVFPLCVVMAIIVTVFYCKKSIK